MLASVLLIIGYLTVIPISGEHLPWAIFLTTIIPEVYLCKGDYSLFFKKIRLRDVKLIILCIIAAYLYTIIVAVI